MFTGIIEEVGTVRSVRRSGTEAKIEIQAKKVLGNQPEERYPAGLEVPTIIGDSIAVNGVCLTVTSISGNTFTADVMPETFSRSSLGSLRQGDPVSLERAMPAYGRFGGHIVSGHIDGTGKILSIRKDGNAVWFRIGYPRDLIRYIVEKGSVAIDGISLTVASVSRSGNPEFQVSVIPHTLAATSLAYRKVGDIVNLETDIIGKYTLEMIQR